MLCRVLRLASGLRAFSSAQKAASLGEDGYEVVKNLLQPEEIEGIKRTANNILNYLDERKEAPRVGQDYLYFSGGYLIKSKFSVYKITDENKLIVGPGIAAMGQRMDDLEPFKEFACSTVMQKIAAEKFNMRAPALAGMSYIFEMKGEWSNFRKENAFYRTNPLSTKGILVSLSDMPKDEGFFMIPNSHKNQPATFYRKSGIETTKDPPKETDQEKQIVLEKGNILIYDGNLNYKMYSAFNYIEIVKTKVWCCCRW
eukprot:TRINITY_DN11803_c0_g1_i3.p1 TRINITY_DN11803_c0_g1~~TRINITY_DN11803_c0_g1_i3.p1  ORF type:complete len:256 (-),score=56.41 TRINITY_DN11803_c0_g1_i3:244-1011(-)